MALGYTIREGLAGFRRAPVAVFTAVSALTVALVLLGLWALLAYQFNHVVETLRQQVGEVEVFLQEETDEASAQSVYARAHLVPGVSSARYVSREEAMRVFRETFGNDGDFYANELFLPPSIRLRVDPDYAHPDSLARLSEELQTWNHVDEVILNRPLLERVQRNIGAMRLVGAVLGLIVGLAAVLLVANTIRLTIYARRLLIRTMKLVGATNRFISGPFIVEGIVQGLLAGVLAALALWPLFFLAVRFLPQLVRPDLGVAGLVTIGLIVGGAVMGWAGSALAARRFIRRVALH